MYILDMNKISATAARQNFAQTVSDCREEPVTITDHGREVAVMMHPKLAKVALAALEDAYDIKTASRALKRVKAGERTYSLEEVAKELGISLESI